MADVGGHARHDPLDAAAATDRGASLPMTLRRCRSCLELHADLLAIAAAVPLAAIPWRPRDLTLTAADADRLRARGWRRLLDAFGSARDEISRPLAVGFATLGVIGLFLTAVPMVLPMDGAGGAAASDARSGAMELEPASASAAPYVATNVPELGDGVPVDAPNGLAAGPSALLIVSGAFLGAGGVLFGARVLARRRGPVR